MKLADRIRAFVGHEYAIPARGAGAREFRVRAGDVHRRMGLEQRMPAVCAALEARVFAAEYRLELLSHEGPPRGANAVYTFALREPAPGTWAQAPPTGELARPVPKPRPLPPREPQVQPPTPAPALAPAAETGTVYLVSCVGEKQRHPAPARALYTSEWFVRARAFVEAAGAPWFILSAEHGLLGPDERVAPYERTLNGMGVAERRDWAARVVRAMQARLPAADRVVVLAGARYREFLMPYLERRFARVEVPMENLRIGEQLAWLGGRTGRAAAPARMSRPSGRLADLRRLYELVDGLHRRCRGFRRLADCRGSLGWPMRGVYFFFETGELRSDSGDGPRLVRVGTHALTAGSGSTLWGRLSQHRGQEDGGGNHRGSIFRLLVGRALQAREGRAEPRSWGLRGDPAVAAQALGCTREALLAAERPLEEAVGRIVGAMPFLWLAVDDAPGRDSLRGLVERNAIALLSNHGKPPLDAPSPGWLGHLSDRERVRHSGLWNSNHLDEDYDPTFLDRLEALVDRYPG